MTRALLLLLFACSPDPQPCDTLCESAGFNSVDEAPDSCTCSEPDGLGGELGEPECLDYCAAIDADGGTVSSDGDAYTCACGPE